MMIALLIISLLLLFFYSILILYYYSGWKKLPLYIEILEPTISSKISVIIPARNESKKIKDCINSILNQSYSSLFFEIIIIDDFSTDDTAAIVLGYTSKNIKLISLKKYIEEENINSYKKKAIEIAIEQCTGELIVCTDADCIAPNKWLQTINNFYQKTNAAFIAMPVILLPTQKKISLKYFIEIFQTLDFMMLQGITGASVFKKIHSMCNGANLAYTKEAFYAVNGFKGIDNIASGDDMLLMHKIALQFPKKIHFLKSINTIIQTSPMPTVSSFINQRIRWASKANSYKDKKIIVVLLLVYLFNCILLIIPFIILINLLFFKNDIMFQLLYLQLVILILKTGIEMLMLYPVAKFFNQYIYIWWFPFLQPFHLLYTVVAGWFGMFGKYTWKGRQVK